jgi:hypothetical protein
VECLLWPRLRLRSGRVDCVIPLIRGGADVEAKDGNGFTPAKLAAIDRQHAIIALLKSITEMKASKTKIFTGTGRGESRGRRTNIMFSPQA